jgi:hypothetical protein
VSIASEKTPGSENAAAACTQMEIRSHPAEKASTLQITWARAALQMYKEKLSVKSNGAHVKTSEACQIQKLQFSEDAQLRVQ